MIMDSPGGWAQVGRLGRRGSTCRFRGLASCRISVLSGRLLTGGMMRAVWLVLVAGFRRQWRSWVLLSLLIAVASGFVLASAAAGRRTDSAFPRYVASHGYDGIVYTVQPLPKLGQDVVAQVVPVQMPFYGQPGCSCHRTINTGAFSVREVPPASLGRVAKLVAGRMPDPSSPVEALASFTLQRDYGVRLGTVITLPMAA